MKKLLVIGAGRSATSLIRYLLENAAQQNWEVSIADASLDLARQKAGDASHARAIAFDVTNVPQREAEIANTDIVISMLPAFLHHLVAKDCVRLKKHLVTASYVSKEIGALHEDALKGGIILMNEIGLDPGIDHMSAMKIIDGLKGQGAEITSFKSYCGGLIAPESNDNPWGYKFTWNPRNVVLAGQGTAQYIENGTYKYIPYNRLFTQTELIDAGEHGMFESYANRDSLSYRIPYGLEQIPTLLRGTLRMPGYCKAWNAFVKLGWTDDSYQLAEAEKLTYRQLVAAFLPQGRGTEKQRLAALLGESENSEAMQKLDWLGIFEDEPVQVRNASPAKILEALLERKWKLKAKDKDMIVMQHQFEYRMHQQQKRITSSLVVKGDDPLHTAMAKTVGLPAGIAVKLILNGKIRSRGVRIPTIREIYEPVLGELEELGIRFQEKQDELTSVKPVPDKGR